MYKQMKLSDEKLAKVFESFMKGVNRIENSHNRDALTKMMEGPVGERFLAAPASSRVMYHNCFVGGLAEHSLRVYGIFKNLSDQYGEKFPHDDILIAALFHDLGKAGTLEEPYFIPKNSDWHLEKMGQVYDYNDNIDFMQTAQRSLRLLGLHDVRMSDNVYRGILLHDGQYIPENASYRMKEGKFASLLHMADRLACEMEVEKWRKL